MPRRFRRDQESWGCQRGPPPPAPGPYALGHREKYGSSEIREVAFSTSPTEIYIVDSSFLSHSWNVLLLSSPVPTERGRNSTLLWNTVFSGKYHQKLVINKEKILFSGYACRIQSATRKAEQTSTPVPYRLNCLRSESANLPQRTGCTVYRFVV